MFINETLSGDVLVALGLNVYEVLWLILGLLVVVMGSSKMDLK